MERCITCNRPLRRSRLQFTLRSLLVFITLCSVVGWVGSVWRKGRLQREAVGMLTADVDWSEEIRGIRRITYDYERDGLTAPAHVPEWLVEWMGVDCFADVVEIDVNGYTDFGEHYTVAATGELPIISLQSRFTELEYLSLFSVRLSDIDLKQFDVHRKLRTLDLAFVQITGTGFSETTLGDSLRSLTLVGCPKISDEGLASIGSLYSLEELVIKPADRPRGFSHEGLAHLKRLPRLKRLDLYHNLTDADLMEIGKLRSLQYLAFGRGETTGTGIGQLKTLTKLKIITLDNVEHTISPEAPLRQVLEALAESVDSVRTRIRTD